MSTLRAGIINDYLPYMETVVDWFHDFHGASVTVLTWEGMRAFLASPRRVNVLVVDYGELRRPSIELPRLGDYSEELFIEPGVACSQGNREIMSLIESHPEMSIRHTHDAIEVIEHAAQRGLESETWWTQS